VNWTTPPKCFWRSVRKTRRLCIINCLRESINHLFERTDVSPGCHSHNKLLKYSAGLIRFPACTWCNILGQAGRGIGRVEHVSGLYIINQRQINVSQQAAVRKLGRGERKRASVTMTLSKLQIGANYEPQTSETERILGTIAPTMIWLSFTPPYSYSNASLPSFYWSYSRSYISRARRHLWSIILCTENLLAYIYWSSIQSSAGNFLRYVHGCSTCLRLVMRRLTKASSNS
jgi:hypothetical protein